MTLMKDVRQINISIYRFKRLMSLTLGYQIEQRIPKHT